MARPIDSNVKMLAALAYGEASTENNPLEIGGIAFAAANRCRALGYARIGQLQSKDPNYAYAWNGSNERFNLFMRSTTETIQKDWGMNQALEWAQKALNNEGDDPSNGAYWWDGLDFKTNKRHPKRLDGFRYAQAEHNLFEVEENTKERIVYWQQKNKKTGQLVNTAERGRFKVVWVSTAAHGSTIFWKYDEDYLKATGAKPAL